MKEQLGWIPHSQKEGVLRICFNPLNDRRINRRRWIRTAVLKDMSLARFLFSILRCTYLEEPFQHVHLLPTLRETTLQSDRQQTCPELGITFPCADLRYSHAKLSGSRQAERMDSNHQDLVYDQVVPSYLHIPNNPDCTGLAIGLSCYAFPLGNFS